MERHPFCQTFDELPTRIAVFPLSGAVILPGGILPLTIFEPRYLNMVRDAMRSDQLIGMVQPRDEAEPPSLYQIGCAGRICRYEEVQGGRLEILLTGLCRFEIVEELPSVRGYRIVRPDWERFSEDFFEGGEEIGRYRDQLIAALKRYFEQHKIQTDWNILHKLNERDLLNGLFSHLPLEREDKQIVLEAKTLAQTIKSFIAVLDKPSNPESGVKH